MQRRSFVLGSMGAGLAAAGATVQASAADPLVRTAQGLLRGSAAGGVHIYKGVRFAAPPTGANRLQPPQPPPTWDGVREALAFGPKPPQPAYPPMIADLLPPEYTPAGEDCLTLNIWAPEPGAEALPVLVWIAGGMFEYHATGASPWYDGTAFVRDGVILVSINYRVGATGFLYLGDGIANLGLLDQIAALEWVRDNIAAFGGDPGRVTIAGESAGGLSVGTLLAMPRARGLFHRAIVESGGGHIVTSAATALRIGQRLAERLGVAPVREALAAVPPETFIAAQEALRSDMLGPPDPAFWGEVALTGLPWAPVIDGDVVPERPFDLVAAGAGRDVDLLAGSNTEEWRLFVVPGGVIDGIASPAVAGTLAATGLQPDTAMASYADWHPGATPGDLFAAVMTDWYWRLPALRLADAHAAAGGRGRTYMYEFGWRSPAFGGRLGAAHATEILFAFDQLAAPGKLLGPAPPQLLADSMHRAWVSFSATGDPGWPGYDTRHRTTMHFDAAPRLVDDPMARERRLWEGVR